MNKSAPLPKQRVRAGETPVIRIGNSRLVFNDLYVFLLSRSWWWLLISISFLYLVVNLCFAAVYYTNIDGIDHAHTFHDVFFFSVQTMATIGYGYMAPINDITNALTTIEALTGFTFFAFITGLMFAKFSRPTAQVLFSNVAVISNHEGKPHLKIRMANQRTSSLVDVSARLLLLRSSVTKEGFPLRKFVDLKVIRDHMPILRLTWTLMHPIDEHSPLWGMTQEDFLNSDDELFVTLIGLDEMLAQTIHARHSYLPDEVLFDTYFEDVIKRNDASLELNYGLFHSTRKTPPAG